MEKPSETLWQGSCLGPDVASIGTMRLVSRPNAMLVELKSVKEVVTELRGHLFHHCIFWGIIIESATWRECRCSWAGYTQFAGFTLLESLLLATHAIVPATHVEAKMFLGPSVWQTSMLHRIFQDYF
jgi:hypothetical protein